MRNAKYAEFWPGATDHRQGVWGEKVGWLPDGRAVWEWIDQRFNLAPAYRYPSVQVVLSPHGVYYATGPHAGFAWSVSPRIGAFPPPPDGWTAQSTVAPGTPPPPIRPLAPQFGVPLPPPPKEEPWLEWGMNERAYTELMRFVENVLSRLLALESRGSA